MYYIVMRRLWLVVLGEEEDKPAPKKWVQRIARWIIRRYDSGIRIHRALSMRKYFTPSTVLVADDTFTSLTWSRHGCCEGKR